MKLLVVCAYAHLIATKTGIFVSAVKKTVIYAQAKMYALNVTPHMRFEMMIVF